MHINDGGIVYPTGPVLSANCTWCHDCVTSTLFGCWGRV